MVILSQLTTTVDIEIMLKKFRDDTVAIG